jgi:hypothetical protein
MYIYIYIYIYILFLDNSENRVLDYVILYLNKLVIKHDSETRSANG